MDRNVSGEVGPIREENVGLTREYGFVQKEGSLYYIDLSDQCTKVNTDSIGGRGVLWLCVLCGPWKKEGRKMTLAWLEAMLPLGIIAGMLCVMGNAQYYIHKAAHGRVCFSIFFYFKTIFDFMAFLSLPSPFSKIGYFSLSTSGTICGTSPWNEGTRSSSTKLLPISFEVTYQTLSLRFAAPLVLFIYTSVPFQLHCLWKRIIQKNTG